MGEQFHLGLGGPLHRLERAANLETPRRLVPVLLAVTWLPLALLASVERLASGEDDPLMRDLSVHTRLLVAMPLLLVAVALLDRIGNTSVGRLFDEGFVPPSHQERLRGLLRAVERWRDALAPEAVLLGAALLIGIGALVGWFQPAGAVSSGIDASHVTAMRVWYDLVSLPLFLFLGFRALYRWLLWLCVLVAVARTPLALLAVHADDRAGIAFLKTPSVFYCAIMLFATSAVLCSGWATRMLGGGASIESFRTPFVLYVVAGILGAFLPHLMFAPMLLRARVSGLRDYGGLVTDYSRQFHARWIADSDRTALLGSEDIQALADLGTAYREQIERLDLSLFGRADWSLLLVAALAPATPLLLMQGATHDAIRRIVKMLVGA